MTVALWILAYLFIGYLVCTAITLFDRDEYDGEDAVLLIVMNVVWPLVVCCLAIFGVYWVGKKITEAVQLTPTEIILKFYGANKHRKVES